MIEDLHTRFAAAGFHLEEDRYWKPT